MKLASHLLNEIGEQFNLIDKDELSKFQLYVSIVDLLLLDSCYFEH